jgi:RimJ/RimL family protein N-acetyltransferase
MAVVIETDRLVLRRWNPRDAEPFAASNADPRVMDFFPGTVSRKESNAIIDISPLHGSSYVAARNSRKRSKQLNRRTQRRAAAMTIVAKGTNVPSLSPRRRTFSPRRLLTRQRCAHRTLFL